MDVLGANSGAQHCGLAWVEAHGAHRILHVILVKQVADTKDCVLSLGLRAIGKGQSGHPLVESCPIPWMP